jgi:hypothetical protein
MGTDADGRFRLRYDAPAEVGELVRAALAEAKDHLFHTVTDTVHTGDRDDLQPLPVDDDPATSPGPRRVTWADALVLATRSLDAAATEKSAERRARYRVQVHLDTDGGWLTGTPRLPRHAIDGLTCDGTLIPVWETDGRPVNVGRSLRVVPHRTGVLVLDRDRGCRFPGCPTRAGDYLEVHHLTHWSDGGLTDLENLACLCSFHHDGHHRGEFTIAGDPTRPDGLEFTTRHGWPIGPPARPAPGRPTTAGSHPPGRIDPGLPDSRESSSTPMLMAAPTDNGELLTPSTDRPEPRPPGIRPRPRLGRAYPAPKGGRLHLHLVDLTPPRSGQPSG